MQPAGSRVERRRREASSWSSRLISGRWANGVLDILAGDQVICASAGDLVVVRPGLAHAFAAHRDSTADALIVVTPGVERFDYFRHAVRVRRGKESRETLLGLQDHFDTYLFTSPAWDKARS